ncbi:extensin family protein [Rhizobium sp. TH2]|uniref:extensin-like domain-containing protein n=1 Tax=Rhizobium sp. TH2 TaxID=2775403 RepID=UPI0021574258|nr:extensin family protein [Rhizobium sp. TH2]UVC07127.1 extensin family protein [Rhizobium sp. TH2]
MGFPRVLTLPIRSGGQPISRRLPLLLPAILLLTAAALPEEIPVPEPRPDIAAPGDTKPTDEKTKPVGDKAKPSTDDEKKNPATDGEDEKPDAYIPPPIETENPKVYAFCIAEMKAMGAEFTEAKRIDEHNGCGIDTPLEVKSLGGGVELSPPGTMRCQAAVNLARWTRDVVTPMLKKSQPKETLAEVNQASTYVCRKRNNAETGKISEHAHGNAVDIAGFTFQSGKTFTISPRQEDSTLNGAFQRSIATAACLYFSTVLDPGSDKAHETHLHLDTLKRKGGFRYCW